MEVHIYLMFELAAGHPSVQKGLGAVERAPPFGCSPSFSFWVILSASEGMCARSHTWRIRLITSTLQVAVDAFSRAQHGDGAVESRSARRTSTWRVCRDVCRRSTTNVRNGHYGTTASSQVSRGHSNEIPKTYDTFFSDPDRASRFERRRSFSEARERPETGRVRDGQRVERRKGADFAMTARGRAVRRWPNSDNAHWPGGRPAGRGVQPTVKCVRAAAISF